VSLEILLSSREATVTVSNYCTALKPLQNLSELQRPFSCFKYPGQAGYYTPWWCCSGCLTTYSGDVVEVLPIQKASFLFHRTPHTRKSILHLKSSFKTTHFAAIHGLASLLNSTDLYLGNEYKIFTQNQMSN